MSVQPAVVMLDPARREEQLAAIRERVPDVQDFGDRVWMRIDPDQAARFAAQGLQVQLYPAAELVVLPAVVFHPPGEDPQPPTELTAPPPADAAEWYAIVLFAGPPQRDWIDAARALGAVFVDDLPGQASVFRMSAAVAEAVRAQPFVTWCGWYQPAYSISFLLCGRTEAYAAADLHTLTVDAAQLGDTPVGIFFFDDADMGEMRRAVAAAGATITDDLPDELIAEVTAAQVPALARIPGVRVIEPAPPPQLANMRAGVITGVNQVRDRGPVTATLPVELDGTGEIVSVFDSGIDSGVPATVHEDFRARVVVIANVNDPQPAPPGPPPAPATTCQDFETHGTHCVGTIAASGAKAAGFAPVAPTPASMPRGVAPGARIVFISANAGPPPIPPPLPLGRVATQTILRLNRWQIAFATAHAWGARVHSNSWSSKGTNNYTATSQAVDEFAFFRDEDVVVFAAGNDEGDFNGDGVLDQAKLGMQACAKNALVVGASENVTRLEGNPTQYSTSLPAGRFTHALLAGPGKPAGPAPVAGDYPRSDRANDVALFSNRGRVNGPPVPLGPAIPVAQLRVRPDIIAPGTNILSTMPAALPAHQAGPPPNNLAKSVPPAFYYVLSGTSMATPHVAGACALTRQFYRVCYGQLRRPVRISAETVLVDRPAIAPHRDGCVVAWIRGGAQNDVHAARLGLPLLTRTGAEATLQANVGPNPALALARQGDNTVLLHRGADNAIRLSLYDPALAPVAAFGGGVVTLAPLSRPEPERRPAMCVNGGEIAVVWIETGTDNLRFQRFAAADGHAIDAASLVLGAATSTSAAPYVTYDGTHYAVVWARLSGGAHSVLMRFVDNAGALAGGAQTIVTQPQPIAAPHLAWDARNARYLVSWISDEHHASGDVKTQLVDPAGVPIPGALPATVVQVPAGKTLRRAAIAPHPTAGFTLTWEDDTRGTFDAYFALLGDNGVADLRIAFNRLLLSDIPGDTQGVSALVTADAIVPVWHGTDFVNPPLLAVDALVLTPAGAFLTVPDPRAPLLDSGRWVPHQLHDHAGADPVAVAAAWTGGGWFLLRCHRIDATHTRAELVRTTTDGLPDVAFGPAGARTIDSGTRFAALSAYFTGSQLLVATLQGGSAKLMLFDATGTPVAGFGAPGGRLAIPDVLDPAVAPAMLHRGVAPAFQFVLAYAKRGGPGATPTFRLLDAAGATLKVVRDAANRVTGTAQHGWFHYTASDPVPRFVTASHRTAGGTTTIRVQRFALDIAHDVPQTANTGVLGVPAGEARNAVLAPRPAAFDPDPNVAPVGGFNAAAAQRAFGLAFQHRAAAANPWQLRFSHLNRNADAVAGPTQNVLVSPSPNHQTDPQMIWHSDGYGVAWREQPVAGGAHRLMFACIDDAGVLIAPPYAVSSPPADVAAFELAWNGRRFHLTWTETAAGRLRHMQSALSVLHRGAAGGYDRPFAHPSAPLVRATLVNGATNVNGTALPNLSTAPNDGAGWGRLNLRQSLAPAPPVTFHARDDGTVALNATARYVFTLPAGTKLLRVTLNWNDPPGALLQNNLDLKVTTPAWPAGPARVYLGNRWQPANPRFSDPLPAPPAPPPVNAADSAHPYEQVVIHGAPTLPSGDYTVEVICSSMNGGAVQQFPAQPFALVFVGSGDEWTLAPAASAGPVGFF